MRSIAQRRVTLTAGYGVWALWRERRPAPIIAAIHYPFFAIAKGCCVFWGESSARNPKMQPLPSATPQSTAGGRSFCCPFPKGLDRSYGPLPSPGQGAIQFRIAGTLLPRSSWPKAPPGLWHGTHEGGGQSPHRLDEDRGAARPGAVPFSIRRVGSLRLRLGPAPPNPGVTALTSCRSQLAGSFSGRMMRGGGIRPSPSRQPLLSQAAGGPFRPPLRLTAQGPPSRP